MKNRQGYFLNSYSVMVLASVCRARKINLLRARISLLRVKLLRPRCCRFGFILTFILTLCSFFLALLHQIESFHRLQIKPNKLDLSQEKLTLLKSQPSNFHYLCSTLSLCNVRPLKIIGKISSLVWIPKLEF